MRKNVPVSAGKRVKKKATKMAEKEMRELEVTKVERKRKTNFSVNEITVIIRNNASASDSSVAYHP